jgi:extradiol dioxygenase family protein
MQLTLQERPGEVVGPNNDGVRHFGSFSGMHQRTRCSSSVSVRIRSGGFRNPRHPRKQSAGKRGGKLADPSGNVIEVKYYEDLSVFLGQTTRPGVVPPSVEV